MAGTPRRPTLRYDDGGWAEAIGNHVALDLVNTVAWRLDPERTVDRLPDGTALVRWARFVDLVDDDTAAAFHQELTDDAAVGDKITAGVRRTRELVHRVLQPVAVGDEPSKADVTALHRRLLGVLGRAEVAAPMPWEWSTGLRSVSDLGDEVGLWAWRLLANEDPRRIRQCHDADCGWLFLDRTKNASRVWCSSADCGNRTRARRHYQRHTQTSPAVRDQESTRR